MVKVLINPKRKGYAYFRFKNRLYNIFHSKQGVNTAILQKGFEQIDVMQSYHSKVCMVFLELHLKYFSEHNAVMSVLISELKAYIKNKYNSRIGYLWVRERSKAKAQHYHLAVMVDGHKCNNGWSIQQFVNDIWRKQNDNGTTYYVTRPTYNILRNDNTEANAARVRLSYFAKNRTKEQDLSCNCFSSSRIKLNPKAKFEAA